MLVLVNGVSGNIGGVTAKSLLARGHQVRGMGRDAKKVDPEVMAKLESFVTAESWYDTAAHDNACKGVDAIVNATAAISMLMLDGQLLMLRAAERAGVRIFVPSAWNYNWTKTELGYHESYDPLIAFKQQVEETSDIKPIYIFTGVIADYFFRTAHSNETSKNDVWAIEKGTGQYVGDGSLRLQCTTLKDTGELTAELVTGERAAEGGCFEIMSFSFDLLEASQIYERVTGKAMKMQCVATDTQFRDMAYAGRANGKKNKWMEYIGPLYTQHTVEGRWLLDENNLFNPPSVRTESLAEHFERNKHLFKNCPNKA